MILCVDCKELVNVELSEVVVQAKLYIPSTQQSTIHDSLHGCVVGLACNIQGDPGSNIVTAEV